MRKIILLTTMLISLNCICQTKTSDILEKFKFGSEFKNTTEFEERFIEDGLASYSYNGLEAFKIGSIEVNNINLVYFENKLMVIEVNFGNPSVKDNFELDEFNKVKESLMAEIGKNNFEKNNPNPTIINEIDWKKENTNLNLKRLNFEYEGENCVLGLLLIRDIEMSENFMLKLKK